MSWPKPSPVRHPQKPSLEKPNVYTRHAGASPSGNHLESDRVNIFVRSNSEPQESVVVKQKRLQFFIFPKFKLDVHAKIIPAGPAGRPAGAPSFGVSQKHDMVDLPSFPADF